MNKHLPLFLAAFLGASLNSAAVQPNNIPNLELPLILNSERAELLGGRSVNKTTGPSMLMGHRGGIPFSVSELTFYKRLPTHKYEPVGLHIDTNPPNEREAPGSVGFRNWNLDGTGRGLFPTHTLASHLAWLSRRNVLVSARVEKRGYERVRFTGTGEHKIDRLLRHLEKNGVESRLLGDDTYVLFEVPEQEAPFPYDRTRAIQYEKEREIWLVENEDYTAQGLIYQPTPVTVADSAAPALSEKQILVRHAAAWLAKAMHKEVFVQAAIEKNRFKFPDSNETVRRSYAELMTRQLNRAGVKIVELSPRAIALTQE